MHFIFSFFLSLSFSSSFFLSFFHIELPRISSTVNVVRGKICLAFPDLRKKTFNLLTLSIVLTVGSVLFTELKNNSLFLCGGFCYQ